MLPSAAHLNASPATQDQAATSTVAKKSTWRDVRFGVTARCLG
jgi:hypothetical protein